VQGMSGLTSTMRFTRSQGLSLAGFAVVLASCVVLLRFPPDRYELYVCPFRAATGLLCPGCGGTHAVAALLRGNLREAWRWNALVVSLAPFALAYGVGIARRVVRGKAVWIDLPQAAWIALAVVTVAFGVMRNLRGWG
jgi:hypothetical protein